MLRDMSQLLDSNIEVEDHGYVANKPWWVFFPLKGLEITDPKHDLKTPLFGDTTVIARSQMKRIVPLLKLNKRHAPGHDHEADILHLVTWAGGEEYSSYVAVKRTGQAGHGVNDNRLADAAEDRAFVVAAVLSIVFLAESRRGETCGLVQQLHRRKRDLAMLEINEGGFVYQGGGGQSRIILDRKFNIQVSRSQLKNLLRQDRYQGLANTVLIQQPELGKSLRNANVQSALRLADAVHAISYSSQLLGAVTAIEILVAEMGDSYDTIKKRLCVLIGDDAVNLYQADAIFQARHRYVHKGEEVELYDLATNAVALALQSLLNYSNASFKFRSKLEIVQYLDFVALSNRISSIWNEAQQRSLVRLLKHSPKLYSLAFVPCNAEISSSTRSSAEGLPKDPIIP